jgi:pimeloyl-ACP methyl ester carboxylesterase
MKGRPTLRFVQNKNVTLAIESLGEGPRALLFVHGWISARRMWYEVAGRLDPLRYTATCWTSVAPG